MTEAISKDGFLTTVVQPIYSPPSGTTGAVKSIHFSNSVDGAYKVTMYRTKRGGNPFPLYSFSLDEGDYIIDNTGYEITGADSRLEAKSDVETVSFVVNALEENTRDYIGYGKIGGSIQVYDKYGNIKGTGGSGGGGQVNSLTLALEYNLDGGGLPIQAGLFGDLEVPFDCIIQRCKLVQSKPANVAGSMVMDVWKSDFISFPPTVANSITGTSKPTLVNQFKSVDETLAGWNRNIASGSWLRFSVVSCSVIEIATISLEVIKT